MNLGRRRRKRSDYRANNVTSYDVINSISETLLENNLRSLFDINYKGVCFRSTIFLFIVISAPV